jgi:SAM-dependent methyltransferase
MKLNVGCGGRIIENSIGIDIIYEFKGTDCVADMHDMPFKSNTFDEIWAYAVLEHSDNLLKVMEEIWRVGMDGCIVHILVPYYNSSVAVNDPTHKQLFTENTMNHFEPGNPYEKGFANWYTKSTFKVKKTKFETTKLGSMIPKGLLIPMAHIFGNMITGIEWELVVMKKHNK